MVAAGMNGSNASTPVASLGPSLATTTVYVTWAPGRDVSGVTDFVIDRSASTMPVTCTDALLFVGSVSVCVSDDRVTVLTKRFGTETVATIVRDAVAPDAMESSVQRPVTGSYVAVTGARDVRQARGQARRTVRPRWRRHPWRTRDVLGGDGELHLLADRDRIRRGARRHGHGLADGDVEFGLGGGDRRRREVVGRIGIVDDRRADGRRVHQRARRVDPRCHGRR